MAYNRADRIGTIFSRVTALVQGGALAKHNVPLWYKVYEAFPPKYEPTYSRPASKKPIRDIFYEEDILRAKLHKQITHLQSINLKSKEHSETQKLLIKYSEYLQEGFSETEAFDKVLTAHGQYSENKILKSTPRAENFYKSKVTTNT